MKRIAIISFWKWDFQNEVDELSENDPETKVEYTHINSINSIPKDVRFDKVIVTQLAEDCYSYYELEAIQGSIPV